MIDSSVVGPILESHYFGKLPNVKLIHVRMHAETAALKQAGWNCLAKEEDIPM